MIYIAFFLSLIALVLQGVLMPQITLLPFAPFLGICLLKSGIRPSLWWAALAGFLVDLFSDDPMGLHALNYVLVSAMLYGFRKRLSYEEPLHLGLYTSLISFVSTLLQLFLLFLFDRRVPIHGQWILIDLLCMPLIDGIYAVVWLSGPLWALQRLRYKWVLYWLKKKNLSHISP